MQESHSDPCSPVLFRGFKGSQFATFVHHTRSPKHSKRKHIQRILNYTMRFLVLIAVIFCVALAHGNAVPDRRALVARGSKKAPPPKPKSSCPPAKTVTVTKKVDILTTITEKKEVDITTTVTKKVEELKTVTVTEKKPVTTTVTEKKEVSVTTTDTITKKVEVPVTKTITKPCSTPKSKPPVKPSPSKKTPAKPSPSKKK
jgi:hypothetical protein